MKKIILFICLLSIVFSALSPLKVLAIDIDFYSSNDILFYNPDDQCGSSSSDGGDNSTSDADYNKRLETVLKFLTGKGLSLAAAAGVAANLKYESGIAPTRIQGTPASVKAPDNYVPVNGTGFGIAQWTWSARQTPLMEYAKSQGKSITNLDIQLDFLWKEATTGSDYKQMMINLNSVKSDTPYNGVDPTVAATILFHGETDRLMQNPTVQKVNPTRGFEGSADTGDRVVNKRGAAAKDIYSKYKGQIPDGTGVAGVDSVDNSSQNSSFTDCGDGAISGNIVATAISFALDKPATNGMNAKEDAKPAYIAALDTYNKGANWADCGIFVATVMIASEVDKSYPKSGTNTQLDYVRKNTDKYQVLESPQKNDLQAGDILIVNNGTDHHTVIYTGNSPYPAVDASQDKRVPSVRDDDSLNWILGRSGVIAARIIK